jgi:hypothetical protein
MASLVESVDRSTHTADDEIVQHFDRLSATDANHFTLRLQSGLSESGIMRRSC